MSWARVVLREHKAALMVVVGFRVFEGLKVTGRLENMAVLTNAEGHKVLICCETESVLQTTLHPKPGMPYLPYLLGGCREVLVAAHRDRLDVSGFNLLPCPEPEAATPA